jgi:type IV pilus assembly protein PilO
VIKNKAQKLPGYIAQEEMLLTINNFILGSGIKIANIGLTNMEDANLSDIIKKSGISDPAIIEADKYNIFSSSMNLSYEGTYDQLYSFIKSVENNERYIFVSNISIDRQNATQVSGNMSVSFVGVGGIGINDEYNLEVPEIKDPKNNIFEPYEGYVEAFNPTGEIIKASPIPFSQADFSIVINSYLDNAGKVIMKTANNPDSDLVYNKNSYVTGSFSVSGTDGSYKYAYSIGENYSTGTIVLPENRTDKINLIVVSSERRDSFDKVGFSLSITSGADVPVYIYVVNEDDTLPRFKVGRMSGNVYVR